MKIGNFVKMESKQNIILLQNTMILVQLNDKTVILHNLP